MKRMVAACIFFTAAAPTRSRAQEAPPVEVLAAPAAGAEQDDDDRDGPGECTTTTTTTTRCTGAAARYGAPSAPLPRLGAIVLDISKLDGNGWRVVEHSDGTLWRERHRSTDSPGLWGSGLALFTISWLASGVSSLTTTQQGPIGFLPVLGAWMNAGVAGTNGNQPATALWAIGGFTQAAGFAMFLIGLAAGASKLECQPVLIAPGAVGSGSGLNALGRF